MKEADNAGRFAGDDAKDSGAKQQALRSGLKDTTGDDANPFPNKIGRRNRPGDEESNATTHGVDVNLKDFAKCALNGNAAHLMTTNWIMRETNPRKKKNR